MAPTFVCFSIECDRYIEELLALQHIKFFVQDAVVALLLWRVPIHSAVAFILATTVVERPQLLPSYLVGCIAWMMLAIMDYRRSLPDLWSRCKTYDEFLQTLVSGHSNVPPVSIQPFENYDKAKEFNDAYKRRVEAMKEEAKKAYEESMQAQLESEKEIEEIGDTNTDFSTKRRELSVDPFKPILYPIQQDLALLCRYIRHIKYILTWEECYISFWATTACILVSLLFLFVPWFYLIQWGSRIVVWTVFGPWMKLVDVYYIRNIKPLSEDEQLKKLNLLQEKRRTATRAAAAEARIKREEVAKMKDMKKYLFGKFVVRVPVLKEDRFRDLPLPQSSSCPYRPDSRFLSELAMRDAGYHTTRLPGQHLVGEMIPHVRTTLNLRFSELDSAYRLTFRFLIAITLNRLM
jgi:hypothetical protein